MNDLQVPRIVSNAIAQDAAGFALADRDFLDAVVEHKQAWERYPKQLSLTSTVFGGCLKRWPEMIRQRGENPAKECRECSSCPAPKKSLAIQADGAILICNHLPGLPLGYVGKDSIAELWKNSSAITRFQEHTTRRVDQFSKCADCPWAAYCLPSCPASTGNVYGEGQIATTHCLRHYMEIAPDFDFEVMKWK